MASPASHGELRIKFPPMVHPLFSQKLALEESSSILPNVTYDLQDFQTPIFIRIGGLILFFIFYQILDRFHNWLRVETFEQDIELGDIANHPSLTNNSNWSHEATMDNHIWLLEILDVFMALLKDRQGLSQEDLDKGLPLVNYKSLGKT
ncbi:hypothetical protein DITRI_Ditri01bG0149200 [Diplodiscus trichospermus]